MEALLLRWVTAYGPPAIFGLLVFGVVGLPVPDETLLALAGAFVRRGDLPLWPTAVAAAGGAITGITFSYALGRYVGLPVLHRYGRYVHVSARELGTVHAWFDRTGRWALVFGYFVPGVRHLVAFVAGSSELRPPVFAAFAYAGALFWTATFLSLGYVLGDEWRPAVEAVRHHVWLLAGGAAVAAIAYVAVRRFQAKSG